MKIFELNNLSDKPSFKRLKEFKKKSIKANSQTDLLIEFSDKDNAQPNIKFNIETNSKFNLYLYGKISNLFQGSFTVNCSRPLTESNIYALVEAKQNAIVNLKLTNIHTAPKTKGDILGKGIVRDGAKLNIPGLIRIEASAKNTESYLTENILLLSPEAKSEADPVLEILNHNVKASHSATVGQLPKELIYYLNSRGLDRSLAEKLLVKGFINSLLEQIPNLAVREKFKSLM